MAHFVGFNDSAVGVPDFMSKVKMTPLQVETNVANLFHIHGDLCQVVHILLAPGQKIQAEPGTMCYMSEEATQEVKVAGIGRLMTSGSLFKILFHNKSKGPGYIGLTANFPATIIPINLDRMGGGILCKHDAFLAAMDPNAKVDWKRLRPASALACCCSGLPFMMQVVKASGWVFLAAHGSIVEKKLADGEKIVCDTDSIVAFTEGMTVDVEKTGGCLTCCFGGEGVFNTAMVGPGTIYLCSMPMEKLRKLFSRPKTQSQKKKGTEGGPKDT